MLPNLRFGIPPTVVLIALNGFNPSCITQKPSWVFNLPPHHRRSWANNAWLSRCHRSARSGPCLQPLSLRMFWLGIDMNYSNFITYHTWIFKLPGIFQSLVRDPISPNFIPAPNFLKKRPPFACMEGIWAGSFCSLVLMLALAVPH